MDDERGQAPRGRDRSAHPGFNLDPVVPHQIGIILRELERAREDVTREANSSTCNPLLIPNYTGEGHEFLSGGNWDATVLGTRRSQ